MNNTRLLVFESIEKLDTWLEDNGWSGYDPYDIKDFRFIHKINRLGQYYKFFEVIRELIFEIFYSFPLVSRKLLGVKPAINPKGMGLFASSYLDLYRISNNPRHLEISKACLKWLENNKVSYGNGIGWGYPFGWQSEQFVPKNTPNGIVTTIIAQVFWQYYQFEDSPRYLDICVEICDFLTNLPIYAIDNDRICFSYTPIFQNHIHNLNLFVADLLIKVGIEIGCSNWVNLGNKAVNYTLTDQKSDGSFDYNGPPEKPKNRIDNYHTGFVLQMLYSIWNQTNRQDVYNSLIRCYGYYTDNFFEDNTIPKLLPNRKYRIDIHSCGESINCLSELSTIFPEGLKICENIIQWTIKKLQDESGYFYYGILKSRILKKPILSKIPYIRWGQAWMHRGLTNYLLRTLI